MEKTAQPGNPAETQNPAADRRRFSLLRESLTNPSLAILIRELEGALRGCETVLDVGCGNLSPMRFIRGPRLAGVDGYAPALQQARSNQTHDEFFLGDVKRLSDLFPSRRFDACVALDVIEHLPKED